MPTPLPAMHTFQPGVLRRLDLTPAFETHSQWSLAVTGLPGENTAVGLRFVRQPSASHRAGHEEQIKLFPGERSVYAVLESRIVFSKPAEQGPLLLIKACTPRYGNCNSWISTLLYAYDRASDSFRTVFFGLTASDAKQITFFVEGGPLLGRVVAVTLRASTDGSALGRVVEVYKRSVIGEYLRVLVYCSATHCSDADTVSVIDSEMPEILRRLGMDQKSALAS